MSEHSSQKPTGIRYLVLLVTFGMAFLLYLHRFCMSYAQRYVREDLSLTNDDLSFCFSAFFFSYALAQVPSGWLSDRFGARTMLTIYILVWSFFTATMGFTVGFASLLLVRLATGIGQAGAYPTAAGLIARWMPMSQRGTASGFVAWGGRLGSGLAPVLTTGLIILFVPMTVSPRLSESDLLDTTQLQQDVAQSQSSAIDDPVKETLVVEMKAVQSDGDRDLVELLNFLIDRDTAIIRGPALDLPLEREARTLLEKSDEGHRLSSVETRRLNRLIVEAAWPDAVRKLYGGGWRQVMWTYGASGLLVAAAFWIAFRNRPAEHPLCNAAEYKVIDKGKPAESTSEGNELEPPPFRAILTSRSLWLICVAQWGSNVGWVFLVTWLPRFLFEVHQLPLIEQGLMCAIPLWIGWAGMLLGGRMSDVAVRKFGLRWGRLLPMTIGRFLAMTGYLLCLLHPSPWGLVAVFGLVAFSTDLGSASGWAYKQDVGGRHIGSIHGWANMWGNLGATISPILLNWVVGDGNWDAAFMVCAAAFCISGCASLGVDATVPIDPSLSANSDPI